MELRTVMRTTPSTREFTDDDLPDDVLYDILEVARFAPNGGNRQSWKAIVVRDRATKERIRELYDLGWREYAAHRKAGLVPFAASEGHWRYSNEGPVDPAVDLEAARATPVDADTSYLVEVPVLLAIVADLSKISAVDTGLNRLSIVGGGSVYPFAHNVLLAARDAGYGGHITSVLVRQEPALRELLHIPEGWAVATVLPLGKPVRELTKLRRDPVEDFATTGTFDGPTFTRP
jgi:nitroreductase